MVKGVRIARAVLLLLRTLRTAIFLSAGKDSSTRSNSVFSSAASAPPAAAPPAPGAIIIMPPPPPADASTSKVSSIALTSSDASSRVMDFSLSMTHAYLKEDLPISAASFSNFSTTRLSMPPHW